MLTLQQIQHTKVDFDIVKEGVIQAEKRLEDALDTKTSLEQKAFTLLGGYITISIAAFGFVAARQSVTDPLSITLMLLGIMFCAGTVALVLSLRTSVYGTLGRYPDTWLQPNTLDGDKSTLAVILAYILHGFQERIEKSDNSNSRKAKMLDRAIYIGAAAPPVFCAALLIIYLY